MFYAVCFFLLITLFEISKFESQVWRKREA